MSLPANQVIATCISTNDLAKELAENSFPHGTWISSESQENGRGRLGRKWASQKGNLFLSIVVRVEDKSLWGWVPLTTAVGITRSLRQKYPGINFQIKWPNDLRLFGKKLGGILCESVVSRRQSFIVIGIGMNCLQSPDELDQEAIDLTTAIGRGPIQADEVRSEIIQCIIEEIDHLVTAGSSSIVRAFEEWNELPPGTEIQWGNPVHQGHIHALGSSGELLVENESGNLTPIFADDIHAKIRSLKKKEAPKL